MIFIATYENRNPYVQSKQPLIKPVEKIININNQKQEQEHPTKGKRFDKSV